MRLEGKVAVVTGGASGMGKATVLRFLAEGASVVAADLNEANGKVLLDEASSDRLSFVRVDVAEESDIEHMVDEAVSRFGGLDVIFNNAGVGGAIGPVTKVRVEDWDYTFAVLCRGVFLGTKHGVRAMQQTGRGGSVINTASVAGLGGGAGPLAYSAAKAAVVNFTKAVSLELAEQRIRVNAICPGAIATPLLAMGRDVDDLAADLKSAQPWPEAGRGEDIASLATYLAGDESRFVTGTSITIDGGLLARGPALLSRRREEFGDVAGVSRGSTGDEPFTIYPD